MVARLTLFAVAMVALTAEPSQSQVADVASQDRHRRIDAIFAPWSGPNTPGCAVGVSRSGVVEYVRGYGLSNLEDDVPITPASVFHVASITKQFTAFSIGLLVEDGLLSLDDDIRRHLPEIPDYGQPITISNLIHHTSGLREQGQILNLAGWRGDDLYTQADVLWALSRQRSLNFEPGTEIVYTNAAYSLLALIVQRVSGQSLRAFVEARIFEPLGMDATYLRDDPTEASQDRVVGYQARAGGGWSISVPNFGHYGSTNLQTTVGDLLIWEQNLLDGRVGGPALARWMRTSGQLNDGTIIGYGGGLHLRPYRGLPMVGHDGIDGGYRSDAILFPDQELAVVALCNGAGIAPGDLTRTVAALYLDDIMQPAVAPAVAMPVAEQSALAGVYWSEQTDELVLPEWREGALRQRGSSLALVPIGDGTFRPGELAQEWRFVSPAADSSQRIQPELRIRDSWPTWRVFVRVDDPAPSGAALAAFAGRYYSDETDMTYTARNSDGRLTLSWPRGYEIALDAVGGDRFVGTRGTVTFTRAPSGEIDGFTVSNRRLRRLRADRIDPLTLPAQAIAADPEAAARL